MKRIIIIIVITIALLFALGSGAVEEGSESRPSGLVTGNSLPAQTEEGATINAPPLPNLRCLYYDMASFESSLNQAEQTSELSVTCVYGGILPHHLVAAPMIGRFFSAVSAVSQPDTIVVLAPNHKRIGEEFLQTGPFCWDTPFGILEPDCSFIDGLISTFNAGENFKLLEEEHSISSLVPYIRYSFPNSRIVPILIHGNMPVGKCEKLAQYISQMAAEKHCLVLASIDFSHGLTTPEALKKDEITIKAIESRNYDLIFSIGNEYLDAPPALATFLMTMDLMATEEDLSAAGGINKEPILEGCLIEHGEASKYLKQHVPDTTSYMTWVFWR